LSFVSDLPDHSVIFFPEGIPGFEAVQRFVLLKNADYDPILLLQNVEDEKLSVPVVPAQVVEPNYQLLVSLGDLELLDFAEPPQLGKNVICLLVLILPGQGGAAQCNLFAPIVINPDSMRAKQLMQIGSSYPSVFPLPGG
jgi:flagellar assembly factor FliW